MAPFTLAKPCQSYWPPCVTVLWSTCRAVSTPHPPLHTTVSVNKECAKIYRFFFSSRLLLALRPKNKAPLAAQTFSSPCRSLERCSRDAGRQALLALGRSVPPPSGAHMVSTAAGERERERDSFSSRAAFPKFKLKCWPLQFQFSLSDAREGGSTDRRADRPTERERAVLVHCHIIYERGEGREERALLLPIF